MANYKRVPGQNFKTSRYKAVHSNPNLFIWVSLLARIDFEKG